MRVLKRYCQGELLTLQPRRSEILADGDDIAEAAAKARQAAEGAGLDTETAKDRAADVAADKVAEKAIADGKSAAEAGSEALAAAKAAGVSGEKAKEKAVLVLQILLLMKHFKGLSEEEARDRAKATAEEYTVSTLPMQSRLLRTPTSDAKDAHRPFEGNRTPIVGMFRQHRLKALSCYVSLMTSRSLMTFHATSPFVGPRITVLLSSNCDCSYQCGRPRRDAG